MIGYTTLSRWREQQRNQLGPLYCLEQYGRTTYDKVGHYLSWISAIVVVGVIIGSIVAAIVGGFVALYQWADKKNDPPPAPVERSVESSYVPPDLCGLEDVYCDGEAMPVVGKASWLVYELSDSCATRDWPKQTKLLVSANSRSVTCVVRDFGPSEAVHPDRIIDLSLEQFAALYSLRTGVAEVTVKEI